MKRLITICAVVGVMVFATSVAYALDYPDPGHPPLGPWDVEPPPMPPDTYEGSWMGSKTFTVPPGGTTISFDYNFLTHELSEDPPYVNDYFAAALLDSSSDDTLELYYIADVCGFTFHPIIEGGGDGPHGSYFTYETHVVSDSIAIDPTYEGMDVVLSFAVFDLEDPEVDSGVLIDNVSLPVPYGDFSGELLGPGGFIGQDGEGWDLYGGNVHLLPDLPYLSEVDTTGFEGNYAYLSTGPDTMIPEPATIVLLSFGSLLLGRNRKSNKK